MKIKKLFGHVTLFAIIGLMAGCSQDDAASTTADAGAGGSGLSNSTPTGIVTHRDFQILYEPAVPEIFDADGAYTQKEVQIFISADDVNDLVVDGQTIKFRTAWGSFRNDKDTCKLEMGSCYVTWIPGDPVYRPAGDLVVFTAWTRGEEKFADVNDNRIFDTGESFVDLEEPFLDVNLNGQYDTACNVDLVCEMIDVNGNGEHDPADGLYNGSLCDNYATNPVCNENAKSTMIFAQDALFVGTE